SPYIFHAENTEGEKITFFLYAILPKKEHCPGVVVTPHGGAMLASLYICRMSMKLMAHDIL
ncbi:MAG: hypothetical protein IKJ79_02985, partial [Bacteroidaceae bacterium]|nr:hypothetical protein [Bacteroidaceae bacterium]